MQKYDSLIMGMFQQLFDTLNGFASIQKVADLLNAPTRRKALLIARVRRKRILSELIAEDPNFQFDPSCISVYQLAFDYEEAMLNELKSDPFLSAEEQEALKALQTSAAGKRRKQVNIGPLTMIVEQGQIICVKGGASAGKK